jgi:hypothetical protein
MTSNGRKRSSMPSSADLSTMRCPILVLVLGIALLIGDRHAGANDLDRTLVGQDVTVSIASPFTDLPPGGCVPYRVNIRNDQKSAGTWHLTVRATENMVGSGGFDFEKSMTVPANSSASFDLSIPLPVSLNAGYTLLNFNVTGTGFDGAGHQNSGSVYTNHLLKNSPFTVIGNEVLGSGGLADLETSYKEEHQQFYGSSVDAAKLPADWRAYSGVATLILRDSEWLGLTASQHDAICGYVAQGGHLVIYTSENPTTRAPELRLPGPDGQSGSYGFGTILLESTAVFPPGAEVLRTVMTGNPARSPQTVDEAFSTWDLRKTMGAISVNGALIFLFVVLFGSLVGPLNLFVFARGKNRFRLFWTTPLISILASLLLVTIILITDGIGGHGRQFIACYSLPGLTGDAVIQEQTARTAMLLSSHWHSDQDYLITPISEHSLISAVTPIGHGSYSGPETSDESANTYSQREGEFSGNWFRSRHVSGQYLQAIRPSRSVLTVLNPDALERGDAPVVLSSFPQELDRVFLFGRNGRCWTCEHLLPGRKTTCAPSTDAAFDSFWDAACAEAGGKLRPLLDQARNRAGCFYATGAATPGDGLVTLDAIRWQVAQGVYLGPWVVSTSPGSTP